MKTYSVDELNTYISERCLRLYQKLIADHQPFAVALGGEVLPFIRSCALSYANLLFFEGREGSVHIVADGAGNGYPLAQVAHANERSANELMEREYALEQTCIVVGHRNFAHYIWNHLSAFDLLCRAGPRTYCQVFDSFGASAEILGVVAAQVNKQRLPDFKNTLYAGGEYLNAETSARLTRYVAEQIKDVEPLTEVCDSTIVYLGVRGGTVRELTNEVDFYIHLMRTLSQHEPNCFFYLDGFSYCNSNKECERATARVHEANVRIKQIIAGYGGDRYRVINGLHLIPALSAIRCCSFYVTHVGTMQHKVGWFFPEKRGVIVSGSPHQQATAEWHASQVAGGWRPHPLRDEYVVPHPDGLRDSPFSIRNIHATAEYIIKLFFETRSVP
jgi:hypothetical protein